MSSGFRADAVHGKTWGRKGETPVVGRSGQRQSISAASAVNARGAFWYCTYESGLNAELFVTLLRKMMRECQPLAAVFGLGQRLVRRYFDHRQGSRVSIWRIGWSAMRLRTSAR